MLDNNLFYSIILSSLVTLVIYFITNRSETTNESAYDIKELIKIFMIIFIINFCLNYLRSNNSSESTGSNIIHPSGESLLTHSSRPPF